MKFKQFTLLLLSFLMTASVALAQRTITGKITDGKESLIGASITAKGTSKGTATDIDGNYSLSIDNTVRTLVFSYVGYKTQEKNIKIV